MNLNPKTVEFGATLSDPYFAFGFFAVTFAIAFSVFCGVHVLRRRPLITWLVAAVWALNAWILATHARFAIEFIASITYGLLNAGAGAGYWSIGPYVWAARWLGLVALAVAVWLRWRDKHGRSLTAA